MDDAQPVPAVVVGVDGSTAALRAAMWAVDVAVGRDTALRLVYALDTNGTDDLDSDNSAQRAVDGVINAIKAADAPVKIDVDITPGPPARTLVRASRSATMVCVGDVGFHHFQPGRVGSTAANLAVSAHCPVAIIRGHPPRRHDAAIVVEVDDSPDDGVVLEAAVEQAHLRNAALRVITCWQPPLQDQRAIAEGDRQIRARLARRLASWRRRCPDLQIEPVAVHGNVLDHLGRTAGEVQLFIVGAGDPAHVREVVGPAGNAALGDPGCAVLVVHRRHL